MGLTLLGDVIIRPVVVVIAHELEIYRDGVGSIWGGGFFHHNSELCVSTPIRNSNRLVFTLIFVISRNGNIIKRRFRYFPVTVNSSNFHSGQIKFFSEIVFRFVISGKFKAGNGGHTEQRRIQRIFVLCPVFVVAPGV